MNSSTNAMVTQAAMTKAIGQATGSLRMGNQAMGSMGRMQAQAAAYQKESMKMGISEELSNHHFLKSIANDVMEDVFEGNEEAEAEVYSKIFDEVGIEFSEKVVIFHLFADVFGPCRQASQHRSQRSVNRCRQGG